MAADGAAGGALDAPALGWWEALAYGLIQGLTEFLPVSSSGHLKIAHLVGLGALPRELELPFDVLLHGATLLAIVIAFRHDILAACRWRPRLWAALAAAVVPAGLAGLLARDLIEGIEAWWVVGVCYLFTAALLSAGEWVADRRRVRAHEATLALDELSVRQGLLVGLLQVTALLPGVSRSGATIAGGLLGGAAPALAVSFAFLAGLPLIAAAAAKDALDGSLGTLAEVVGVGPLAVAFLASLASGLGAIALLKLLARRRRLRWFALYCVLVAVFCFVMQARG